MVRVLPYSAARSLHNTGRDDWNHTPVTADDTPTPSAPPPAPPQPQARTPWGLVSVALIVGAMLGAGGHALWADRLAAPGASPADTAQTDPAHADALAQQARSLASQSQFAAALPVFRQALALHPGDAALLADTAETLLNLNNQSLDGEPAALVALALARDPANLKALVLAAHAAAAQHDAPAAAALWIRALATVPANQPDLTRQFQARLEEAQRGLAVPATPTATAVAASASAATAAASVPSVASAVVVATAVPSPAPARDTGRPGSDRPAATATPLPVAGPSGAGSATRDAALTTSPATTTAASSAPDADARASKGPTAGTISIAPEIASNLQPTDLVLITVTAEGGAAPLATLRQRVKDLPYRFSFPADVASAAPGAAKRLIVQARVTRAEHATPQSGDWMSPSAPVAPGSSGVRVMVSEPVR